MSASSRDFCLKPLPVRTGWLAAFCLIASWGPAAHGAANEPRHAIAMHGEPAMAADFSHMPYVDPQAPKGGRFVLGLPGTFDSLNPFIVQGLPLAQVRGYVIESLMARGYDEAFTLYGLLARSIETDSDRTYVNSRSTPPPAFPTVGR